MELLRNGFPVATGSCVDVQLYHEVTIAAEDAGEYECRGYHPDDDSIDIRTEIRDLVVLCE